MDLFINSEEIPRRAAPQVAHRGTAISKPSRQELVCGCTKATTDLPRKYVLLRLSRSTAIDPSIVVAFHNPRSRKGSKEKIQPQIKEDSNFDGDILQKDDSNDRHPSESKLFGGIALPDPTCPVGW